MHLITRNGNTEPIHGHTGVARIFQQEGGGGGLKARERRDRAGGGRVGRGDTG